MLHTFMHIRSKNIDIELIIKVSYICIQDHKNEE